MFKKILDTFPGMESPGVMDNTLALGVWDLGAFPVFPLVWVTLILSTRKHQVTWWSEEDNELNSQFSYCSKVLDNPKQCSTLSFSKLKSIELAIFKRFICLF